MTLKRVRITEIVYVNTGGGGGSTSTIDTIGLYAKVKLSDSIDTVATDQYSMYARVALADTATTQSESIGLYAKVNLADTAPVQSDLLTRLGIGEDDTNASPTDALSALAMVAGEAPNPAPTDTVKTGFSGTGLNDTAGTQSESRVASVSTWGASQTSANSTNPANAVGQANNVFATVAGANGLGSNTATMTITIPVASIPASTAGYTLRLYANGTAVVLTTFTATFANTGGTPASGTIVNNASVAGPTTDTALTTIGTALTVTFTAQGALLGGSSWSVDAVAVITRPVF